MIDEKYKKILEYFKVNSGHDELLATSSYVSMDNIHDSVIITGIFLNQKIEHYIIKAKQLAINEYNTEKNRKLLRHNNENAITPEALDASNLEKYNFTSDELDWLMEKIRGVKVIKSKFSRRNYKSIQDAIKEKFQSVT